MTYDCFTFFNETDLLKMRLQILAPYVDKFVIVEADKTQKGESKIFNFEQHINEFSDYIEKIIYIKLTDLPDSKGSNDWSIENYQRNGIWEGIKHCEPDDLILISDLDEIINPEILEYIDFVQVNKINKMHNIKNSMKQKARLFSQKPALLTKKISLGEMLEYGPVAVKQNVFYYYMNYYHSATWFGSIMCRFKNMELPQSLRNRRDILPYISKFENKPAGWHFSYLGGVEQIKLKLKSIIEGNNFELPEGFYSIDEYIDTCLDEKKDIFRHNIYYKEIELNEIGLNNIESISRSFPAFFRFRQGKR